MVRLFFISSSMQTSMWTRGTLLFAVIALLGAGCTSQNTVSTGSEATGVQTTTAGEPSGGSQTSVEIKADGSTTVTTDVEAEVVTVTITGDGFSPASVTIKKGTTVKFVNKGSKAHWPASDPHPSHTAYPEFDAKQEIKSGASWTFTFDKVGSWRYHDNLNSGEQGVIIVTE